jgi:tetratricopeptide (TPR) repeat protein
MRIHNQKAQSSLVGLLVIMAIFFSAIPASAEGNSVETLVVELAPKAAEPGFAALAVSRARGMEKLADSVDLISAVLGIRLKAEDMQDLYVELASMQELLGRYEEASQSWEAAVAAQPGKGDPSWLLSAAACRLAIGDVETATALSKAVLLTTTSPRLITLAMLIEARAMIISGDTSGALARSKDALAVKSSGLQAAALSMARDSSEGIERDSFINRLKSEYPGWPETQDPLATISGWIKLISIPSTGGETSTPIIPAASGSTRETASTNGSASSTDKQAEKERVAGSKPLYYQLGAFRDEANATLLSTRLVRAGFKPRTARKESETGILSIVYLDAGADPGRLMVALKDAGFESWPLFAEP